MAVPNALMCFNLLIVYDVLLIIVFVPPLITDLLLWQSLTYHLLLKIPKLIVLNIIIRLKTFNSEHKHNDNIVFLNSWESFASLMFILALDFIIFHYLFDIINTNILISVNKTPNGFTVNAFGRISKKKKAQIDVDDTISYLETPGSPSILSNSSNTCKSFNNKLGLFKMKSDESTEKPITLK